MLGLRFVQGLIYCPRGIIQAVEDFFDLLGLIVRVLFLKEATHVRFDGPQFLIEVAELHAERFLLL